MSRAQFRSVRMPDRLLVVQELLEQIEQARADGDWALVASLEAEYRLLRGEL